MKKEVDMTIRISKYITVFEKAVKLQHSQTNKTEVVENLLRKLMQERKESGISKFPSQREIEFLASLGLNFINPDGIKAVRDRANKEAKEFFEWTKKIKRECGVLPHPGGQDPHRMPIFSELIYHLGNMLNPFFFTQMEKLLPGDAPRLKMECAQVIADILNSFFDLNFDREIVYQRYCRFQEKQKN